MSSELEILFEDNHLIAINKKASDISQGDKTNDVSLPDKIKSYLKEKYNKPGNVFCGVIHRLDRPTSGVLLFAKTSKALERLNKQFAQKQTKKTYWAVVENKPNADTGTLIHYLKKNEKQNKSYLSTENDKAAKKAILHYTVICSSDNYHLLEINLETGRHHQIRTQLTAIGCQIKGDVKYGAKRANKDLSIHLHARTLQFEHPISKDVLTILAKVPQESLWEWFEKEVITTQK